MTATDEPAAAHELLAVAHELASSALRLAMLGGLVHDHEPARGDRALLRTTGERLDDARDRLRALELEFEREREQRDALADDGDP